MTVKTVGVESWAARPHPGREDLGRDIWLIENRTGRRNPLVGRRIRVTWLRPWGGRPAGFSLTGTLLHTFTPNGRVLLGLLRTEDGREVSVPWSRNYLHVELA